MTTIRNHKLHRDCHSLYAVHKGKIYRPVRSFNRPTTMWDSCSIPNYEAQSGLSEIDITNEYIEIYGVVGGQRQTGFMLEFKHPAVNTPSKVELWYFHGYLLNIKADMSFGRIPSTELFIPVKE